MALSTKHKVALWVAVIGTTGGIATATITTIGHTGNSCSISQKQDHNDHGTQKQGGAKC